MRRTWVWRVLSVVGSGVIGILLAEVAVKVAAPQVTLFPRYVESEDYPIAFPPDSRLVHSRGRLWRFIYTTNSLGRRGVDVPLAETDGRARVVALGDSFTFGIGVDDDDVYTSHLAQHLGSEYAVVNGGMGGWGLDSEIKWYFATGADYDPDFVILQFTANDPTDSFGLTRVQEGGFAFFPSPLRRPAWQIRLSESGLLQKSHLYGLLRSAYDRRTEASASGEAGLTNDTRSEAAEAGYVELLRLFSATMVAEGRALLFVSVTHKHGEELYHYDLDHFPLIQNEVERLDQAGELTNVALPLDAMKSFPTSPEGHQWSGRHHEAAARALSAVILRR